MFFIESKVSLANCDQAASLANFDLISAKTNKILLKTFVQVQQIK